MKRFAIFAALALAACGSATQPLVKNDDLVKHLESQGYTKVLIRDAFSCGSMGRGRHFIGTKAGTVRTGQICYRKNGGNVSFAVDELSTARPATGATGGISNPWRNSH